jgi:hypothetical protein
MHDNVVDCSGTISDKQPALLYFCILILNEANCKHSSKEMFSFKGGGQFIIGQDQDTLGGGFSSPEAFIGQITQLNMWSRSLSLRDIESLRQNCSSEMGDVIAWADISGKAKGAVSDTPVEFCKGKRYKRRRRKCIPMSCDY